MRKALIKLSAVLLVLLCCMESSAFAATITSSSSCVGTYYLQLNINAGADADNVVVSGSTLVQVERWKKVSKIVGANYSYPPTYSYRYTLPEISWEDRHLCGWYLDAACTEPLVFDAANRTIAGTEESPTQAYAKWSTWTEQEILTAPTCESTGTGAFVCSGCEKTIELTVAALGHDLTDATTVLPTYTQDGSKTLRCTRCTYTETTVLPATGEELAKKITVIYDPQNEQVEVGNVPKNFTVILAAYSQEQLVHCQEIRKAEGDLVIRLPEDLFSDRIKLLFLDNRYLPIGPYRTIQ